MLGLWTQSESSDPADTAICTTCWRDKLKGSDCPCTRLFWVESLDPRPKKQPACMFEVINRLTEQVICKGFLTRTDAVAWLESLHGFKARWYVVREQDLNYEINKKLWNWLWNKWIGRVFHKS